MDILSNLNNFTDSRFVYLFVHSFILLSLITHHDCDFRRKTKQNKEATSTEWNLEFNNNHYSRTGSRTVEHLRRSRTVLVQRWWRLEVKLSWNKNTSFSHLKKIRKSIINVRWQISFINQSPVQDTNWTGEKPEFWCSQLKTNVWMRFFVRDVSRFVQRGLKLFCGALVNPFLD